MCAGRRRVRKAPFSPPRKHSLRIHSLGEILCRAQDLVEPPALLREDVKRAPEAKPRIAVAQSGNDALGLEQHANLVIWHEAVSKVVSALNERILTLHYPSRGKSSDAGA